jgi:hypothetical protein
MWLVENDLVSFGAESPHMNAREERGNGQDGGRAGGKPRRRRWWLRPLPLALMGLAVLAAACAATLLGLLASGDPELSRRVVSALNGAIGTDSTRFACDRVRATLFRGARIDHPRILVLTPDGEITWAEATGMRVDYELLRLLFSRRRDFHVVLVGPRVDLAHDRRGDLVMPRFAPAPSGPASSSKTHVDVVIQDGACSMDREGVRFGRIRGSGELVLGGPGASLLIHGLAGSSEAPGLPAQLAVSGLVRVEGDTLRADPLEVALGSSRVSAEVQWDLREARVVEGTLRLHPLNLREFFGVFQFESAEGILNGELGVAGTPSAGSARASLAGEYAGEPIDTLLFQAVSSPGAIEVGGLKLRVRSLEVSGSGLLSTRGALSADLGFRGVNPALLPWWKSAPPALEGSLSGRARIEARCALQRPDAAIAVTLDPGRLGRLVIERGFIGARVSHDGTTSIDSAWVEGSGGRIAAHGSLDKDEAIQADVRGEVTDLAQMDDYLQPLRAVSGAGRIAGRISGTLTDPRFRAVADVHRARFQDGIGCDTLTVEVQGRLKPALDVTANIGARGMSAYGRSLGNADMALNGGRVLRIERYRQAIGDTLLALEAEITFAAEETRTRIDSLSLTAGPHYIWNREAIDLEISHRHVRASHLTLDLSPGTARADLDWDRVRGTIDAHGFIEGLDLARLREIQPKGASVTGVLSAGFMASGPTTKPNLSVHFDILHPRIEAAVGDSLVLDVDYAPGVLAVQRAAWTAGNSRLEVSGSIRPQFTLEEWWRALSRNDHVWAEHASLALEASADSFDLNLLAPADSSLASLGGLATLRATISGTFADPLIDVQARAPRIDYRGVKCEMMAASLTYRDRTLRIDPLRVRQGNSVCEAKGELPIDLSLFGRKQAIEDAPVSLSVRMPGVNLAILRLLIPEIAASSGDATLTAEVRGTPRNVDVIGALQIRDGRLRLAGMGEALQAISLDATFDHERVTVTRATAHQGKKGKFAMTGYWRWPTEAPPPGEPPTVGPRGSYKFHVKATELILADRGETLPKFSGDLDIVNARNPSGAQAPYVTGNVVLQGPARKVNFRVEGSMEEVAVDIRLHARERILKRFRPAAPGDSTAAEHGP